MARGRQRAQLVRWILQSSEQQSQMVCPFKILRSLAFQCPRIKYPKKNCIFIATPSLVLTPGQRFLSCGAFVVQKVPLSGCIKGGGTGLYCSISCRGAKWLIWPWWTILRCCEQHLSNELSSELSVALSSLSPEPGLWNYARVWPIKPCAEPVTVFDQHIIKTFSWLGSNWVKLNYFLAGWKALGNVIWLWIFLALRYGELSKPALLILPEKLLFLVLVWRVSAPKGCP